MKQATFANRTDDQAPAWAEWTTTEAIFKLILDAPEFGDVLMDWHAGVRGT
jgi:hypothetical protein